MNILVILSSLIAVAVVAALTHLVRKIAFNGKTLPVTTEWIEELSVDRYRPMLRLLDGGETDFLRSQPGFTPKMAKNLRAQRLRIFGRYLTSLESDFAGVCTAVKLVMMQSNHDRPELAEILVRQQITFATTMFSVRLKLVAFKWGLCAVDVTSLVKLFDSMRIECRSQLAVEMGSAA